MISTASTILVINIGVDLKEDESAERYQPTNPYLTSCDDILAVLLPYPTTIICRVAVAVCKPWIAIRMAITGLASSSADFCRGTGSRAVTTVVWI